MRIQLAQSKNNPDFIRLVDSFAYANTDTPEDCGMRTEAGRLAWVRITALKYESNQQPAAFLIEGTLSFDCEGKRISFKGSYNTNDKTGFLETEE